MSGMPATIDPGAEPRAAKSPAPTARLTVDVKRDLDLRPEDAAALDALIESRPQAGVFLSRTWLSGFFAEPPQDREPLLVLLREGTSSVVWRRLPCAMPARTCEWACWAAAADPIASTSSPPAGFETACSDLFLSWLGESFGQARVHLRAPGCAGRIAAVGRGPSGQCRTHAAARPPAAGHSHAAVSRSRRVRDARRHRRVSSGPLVEVARQAPPLARAPRPAANRDCSAIRAKRWRRSSPSPSSCMPAGKARAPAPLSIVLEHAAFIAM